MLSGAVVATGTQPAPPWACLNGHASAGTLAETAWGATVGENSGIRDS